MPRKKSPGKGHNSGSDMDDQEIKDAINAMTKDIIALENKRSSINADINAHRKKIKSMGVDLDAWKAQKRRAAMDEDERIEFDRSATLVANALGKPIQTDMFDQTNEDDPMMEGEESA